MEETYGPRSVSRTVRPRARGPGSAEAPDLAVQGLGQFAQGGSAFSGLGGYIRYGSKLDPRLRELAILRVGWLCGAPYEFGEHVVVAHRIGLTDGEIERVAAGSAAEGWTTRERAVLRAVEELHADAMIADGTWAELARHFDDRQLVELPMLVGHYHMTAFVQNALRIPLNAHNRGLAAGVGDAP